MSALNYVSLAKKYLSQAKELLGSKEYTKCGEMFWEAAAGMVKAVAASRGVELKTHRQVWGYVAEVARETGDKEITKLFHVADVLHTNFYEDALPAEVVASDADFVEALIHKLEKILTVESH